MTSQAYLVLLVGASALGAAFQTQSGWLFVMGAIGLALIAVAAALAHYNQRAVVLRDLPVEPVFQGTPALLRVAVSCRAGVAYGLQVLRPPGDKRAKVWWWLRGTLVPSGWSSQSIGRLVPGDRAEIVMPVETPTRGEFATTGWWVQSAFPLGLVTLLRPKPSLTSDDGPPGRYLVYPVAPRLDGVPWLEASQFARDNTIRVTAGHGLLLRGVREYRSGDAWRMVHWRTTARRGAPHVKETEREVGEALVIWLDLRQSVHSPESLEHVVTVATALYQYLLGKGREVRLVCHPDAEPALAGHQGAPGLAWLAKIQATAPADAPTGPPGAILIGPAYLPGWQSWAAHFVYCPPGAANRLDASAFCPVGSPIAGAMAAGPAS